MAESNHILQIRTVQVEAFKNLMEALKEIFKDVVIKFRPKSDSSGGGMSILAVNNSSNILVKLNLPAEKFQEYVCRPILGKEYIDVGVNMSNMHKVIKTCSKNDELSLFIENDKYDELGICMNNPTKNCSTTFRLVLLELTTNESIRIDKQEFDFVITMPSSDFHSIIKHMSIIAEQVEIKFVSLPDGKSNLFFTCKGDFASQETIYRDYATNGDGNMISVVRNEANKPVNSIIQGVYDLKSLALFSKCANLCSNIELYIKNDYPLVIRYMVADLGYVYLLLSQVNNAGIGDNDSDFYGSDDEDA